MTSVMSMPRLLRTEFEKGSISGGPWLTDTLFLGTTSMLFHARWEYELTDLEKPRGIRMHLIEFPYHYWISRSDDDASFNPLPHSPDAVYGCKVIDAVVMASYEALQKEERLLRECGEQASKLLFAPREAHTYHFWLDEFQKENMLSDIDAREIVRNVRGRILEHLINTLKLTDKRQQKYFWNSLSHNL